MNRAIIRITLGKVLKVLSVLLLVPTFTGIVFREKEWIAYLISAAVSLAVGFLFTAKKDENSSLFLREGCMITVCSWILISIFGALPFLLTGEIKNPVDALFESVSGFTTTGATIFTEVEHLSHATLMWRSLTHWIGGMGVLVFLLALIPMSGGGGLNLMRAESTGPAVGKLVPKIREYARILYTIYIILTLLQVVLLLLGRTPIFDSLNIALSTTGTGGFGIHNDSLLSYSHYVQWVTIVFMALSALKFEAFYFIVMGKLKRALSQEVIAYVLILLVSFIIIYIDIRGMYVGKGHAARDAAFGVSSIMSTTGFATADFNTWPTISRTVLTVLCFIGGCTGSTGGGFKVARIVILLKAFRREVLSYLSPNSVKKVRMDDSVLDEEVIRATGAYFSIYIIIFVGSLFLVSIAENDLVTNFTSVAATLNNVGPGLELVGPTGNYAFHTMFSKVVLIFDMLAGRLEIFPILVFFLPSTIKGLLKK